MNQQDPGSSPKRLPKSIRDQLNKPERPYYISSDGFAHSTRRRAAEANARFEEVLGRRPCQGLLDDPNWGK